MFVSRCIDRPPSFAMDDLMSSAVRARILVVEDSPSMRGFVRAALEGAQASLGPVEVSEAQSGFEALRLLPRGPYSLVITDVNMPDINGLELVQFIRNNEQHRATRIVIISTQSAERDRERGLKLGANAFLAKPFTVDAIVEMTRLQLAAATEPARPNG
ncbi:MAG TPA: response regulator [Polyangiaceae bacterium]|nr:response regulator [Polyangiaceae bacterium]